MKHSSALAALFLLAASVEAQTIEPRITSETLPSGGLMQIKMMLTAPRPIIVGSGGFDMDAAFDGVEGVSLFSPAGDAYGVAVRQGRRFVARVVSPQASLGTQLDYPFLVVAATIRPGLAAGTRIPIAFDPSTTFQGPGGSTYPMPAPQSGELTIGGSISITNVVPGGGLQPAGATVRILGTGFTTQTRVTLNEIVQASTQFVSASEIDVVLGSAANMTGVRIRARNNVDNHQVTYFSYLRPVAVGASSRPLLAAAHPMFSTQTVTSAGLSLPAAPANGFVGVALLNDSPTSNTVTLQLRSPAGAALGTANIAMPAGTLYQRTIPEVFGVTAPAGSVVQVTATAALHLLGLTGDESTGSLSAFAAGAAPPPATGPLIATPTSLTYAYQVGNAAQPAAQTVNVATTGAPLSFTVTSNVPWLTATPASGTTSSALTVSVNTAGLGPGNYGGSLTISSPSAAPQTIPVALNITPPPTGLLTADVTARLFRYTIGDTPPAPLPLNIASTSGTLNFTATASASWLAVSPTSGQTPAALSVSVNPAGLAAGTYNATVAVTASGTTLNVPVILEVLPTPTRPTLTTSVNGLSLSTPQGVAPPVQNIPINSIGGVVAYSATTNASWLAVSPASGQTPANLSVTVNPNGLAPARYNGFVLVTGPGTTLSIAVTLDVNAPPASPQLTAFPAAVNFSYATGSGAPGIQNITLNSSSATGAVLTYSATSSATWLTVSPATGQTPATLALAANPSGLTVGVYNASIAVTAPGATPLSIPVTLTVTAPSTGPQLSASTAALTFNFSLTGPGLSPQTFSLISTGAPLAFTATTTPNWLSVTPASGTTPSVLTVTVNPSGLPPGAYNGSLSITAPGSSPVNVAVVFNVAGTEVPRLTANPTSLSFAHTLSAAVPPPQSLALITNGAPASFQVSANVSWLTVSPSSGQAPATLNALVNPQGLAEGSYSGTITITPNVGPPLLVAVALRVSGSTLPTPVVASVVNAASQLATNELAPGTIITIYGSGLGPTPAYQTSLTPAGTVQALGAPARVWIAGVAAPILYASPTQVNAVVPFELPVAGNIDLQVEYAGVRSVSRSFTVGPILPAIFTQDGSGRGPGSVLNQDYSLNTAANPAKRGTALMIYATGGGQTSPASSTGEVIKNELKYSAVPVTVRLGTRRVPVLFAGAAPGLVAGVLQVNVVVPDGLSPGMVELAIESGDVRPVSSPGGTVVFIE